MATISRCLSIALLSWVLLAHAIASAQDNPVAGNQWTERLSIALADGLKMDLVLVRPGSFMMGSAASKEEKPAHKVTITEPFYLGAYEVTQGQWKALMGDNPSNFKGDSLPVENVSWDDCQKFLAKLKEKLGKGMTCRLPTEAEWEYACRAGSQGSYCSGDDESALGDFAWRFANSGYKTHPVGQKKPNAWGLYDMHGNVWEWCQDGYDDRYYRKSPAKDPQGPSSTGARVLRGGSWACMPEYLRSANRSWGIPVTRSMDIGFRVAVSQE